MFIGGTDNNDDYPTKIDRFRLGRTMPAIPFNNMSSSFYITPEIVLDENDEQLAEHQLEEWGKISHISADEGAIRVRYFSDELPDIDLKARVTVWHPYSRPPTITWAFHFEEPWR